MFTWHQLLESVYRDKRLTWVPHRWRSTILLFPSLWSVAHLSSEVSSEAIRTLLERSREHPLYVIVPLEYPGPALQFNRCPHALDAPSHAPTT